jgi:hypothetical protein
MSDARAVRETANVFHDCSFNYAQLRHFLEGDWQRAGIVRWRNLTALLFRSLSRRFEPIGDMSCRRMPDLRFRIPRIP